MSAIKGLEQFNAKVEKLKKLPQAYGEEMLKRVQQKSPVATGLLKASWVVDVQPGVLNLGNMRWMKTDSLTQNSLSTVRCICVGSLC